MANVILILNNWISLRFFCRALQNLPETLSDTQWRSVSESEELIQQIQKVNPAQHKKAELSKEAKFDELGSSQR